MIEHSLAEELSPSLYPASGRAASLMGLLLHLGLMQRPSWLRLTPMLVKLLLVAPPDALTPGGTPFCKGFGDLLKAILNPFNFSAIR